MSTILELARKRVTVRKFSQQPVDLKNVLTALKAGASAPSGANYQPWRFLIVDDPAIKKKIREASESGEREFYHRVRGDWAKWLESKSLNWSKPYLENAPILVVILAKNGAPYSKESTWLSIGYILLALEEQGLHTVTYTPSDASLVLDTLDTPVGFRLEAILPIGYSTDEKPREDRYELVELARMNKWSTSERVEPF